MKIELVRICTLLPKATVKAHQLKCIYPFSHKFVKKAKPENEIYLSDIRKHNVSKIMLTFALLQISGLMVAYEIFYHKLIVAYSSP